MMKRASLLLALPLASALGCASPMRPLPPPPPARAPVVWSALVEPLRPTPEAPFRDRVPDADGEVQWRPPAAERFSLANGMGVVFVPRHELPVVSVRVVGKYGAGDFPTIAPHVLALVGPLLDQGTTRRSALSLAEAWERLGATHEATIDWDSASVSLRVVAEHVEEAIALAAEQLREPSFPHAEVERIKGQRLAGLAEESTNPALILRAVAQVAVYGESHRYAASLFGSATALARVGRDDVLRAHRLLFAPSSLSIFVAGDVDRARLERSLEAAFGGWKSAGKLVAAAPGKAPRGKRSVVLVDRPNATMAQLFLAGEGASATAADRDDVAVMNAIFGGMFSSRINLNLRERHAYTYGARSRLVRRHGPGLFLAGGAVFVDKVADATRELYAEVAAMGAEPVKSEELDAAKESLIHATPARFETVSDVSSALAELFVYGLPSDDYERREARVAAVSQAAVRQAAHRYLRAEALRLVVVGDRVKLEPALRALGFDAIELRDASGGRVAESKGAR